MTVPGRIERCPDGNPWHDNHPIHAKPDLRVEFETMITVPAR